jgi:hypothetical protein
MLAGFGFFGFTELVWKVPLEVFVTFTGDAAVVSSLVG